MKRMLVLLAMLIGGILVVRRLLPADIREHLSGLHERMMGRMIEHMPEN